jgi:hypothetical protein
MSFSTTSSDRAGSKRASSGSASSGPARRSARRYVVAAIAIATLWLAATMAANIVIDPQNVFGTDVVRTHLNPNARYAALRAYQADPDRYEAVQFASSRGNPFDRDLLARQLGVGAVANFSVPFGLLTDHLPVLQFLLRDKAARGGRLKAVFLVLDADFFGKQPWTNVDIDSFQPPAISGENPLRFWWRYLTAFQFKHWMSDLRAQAAVRPQAHGPDALARMAVAGLFPVVPPGPMAGWQQPLVETALEESSAPEIRSDLAHQLALLTRFVALCREHDVRLVIAFSPLNRQNVGDDQAPDNERIVEAVARLVPVWDFGRPAWLSDRADLWLDFSHYSTAVATMMTQRIFGAATTAPADFGRLKGDRS